MTTETTRTAQQLAESLRAMTSATKPHFSPSGHQLRSLLMSEQRADDIAAAAAMLVEEHAHRLTLQHHAADMAEALRLMTAERANLRDAVIGTICREDAPEHGHWLMPAWEFGRDLRVERDKLRDEVERLRAEREALCNNLDYIVERNRMVTRK